MLSRLPQSVEVLPLSPLPGSRNELREVLRLAAPLALTQIGMQLLSSVDVSMLGRLESGPDGMSTADSMAAAGIGACFAMGLQMPAMGVLMVLDPLVAQAHGAGDQDGVARALRRGLVLCAALALPLCAMAFLCAPILRLLGQPESLIPAATSYVRAVMPGVALQLLFFTFRQVLQAMSITRPLLATVIVANLANYFLNRFFVFGEFGGPELGVLGSGISTSICRGSMSLLVLWFGWKHLRPVLQRRPPANHWPDYKATLGLGIPIGIQVSMEIWVFSAVAFGMGELGELAMAGHQVAISLAAMSFMVPMSVGIASATRVGLAIGRDDAEGVRRAARTCFAVGVGFMVLAASAFIVVPELLASIYTQDEAVLAMAIRLLPVAAAFQLFDGAQVVALGILRGAADTRVPALINFIAYWLVGLPVGRLLAFQAGLGPTGLWWGLTLALAVCSLALVQRVRHTLAQPLRRAEAPPRA